MSTASAAFRRADHRRVVRRAERLQHFGGTRCGRLAVAEDVLHRHWQSCERTKVVALGTAAIDLFGSAQRLLAIAVQKSADLLVDRGDPIQKRTHNFQRRDVSGV